MADDGQALRPAKGPDMSQYRGDGLPEVNDALFKSDVWPITSLTLRQGRKPKAWKIFGYLCCQRFGRHLDLEIQAFVAFFGVQRKILCGEDVTTVEFGRNAMAGDAPFAPLF